MIRVGFVHDPERNFESVVLQDTVSGDELAVQRALAFDEQDRSLGMATYCLCRGGASFYGGVRTWRLAPNELTLTLSTDAAEALELPPTSMISVDDVGIAVLSEHLPRLLAE